MKSIVLVLSVLLPLGVGHAMGSYLGSYSRPYLTNQSRDAIHNQDYVMVRESGQVGVVISLQSPRQILVEFPHGVERLRVDQVAVEVDRYRHLEPGVNVALPNRQEPLDPGPRVGRIVQVFSNGDTLVRVHGLAGAVRYTNERLLPEVARYRDLVSGSDIIVKDPGLFLGSPPSSFAAKVVMLFFDGGQAKVAYQTATDGGKYLHIADAMNVSPRCPVVLTGK